MNNIIEHWITSVLGFSFVILSGVMGWYDKPIPLILLMFTLGLGLVFARDTLIKKLLGKI